MIIDYKLIYPSGTATAHLINSFHTPHGAKLAKKQVKTLGRYFAISFFWGFFKWFYTVAEGCGFESFPSLGLQAYKNKFYFDFLATYVGVGMICPYIVNISVLLGGILSWGIMWPLIEAKKGDRYPASIPANSLYGLQGLDTSWPLFLILFKKQLQVVSSLDMNDIIEIDSLESEDDFLWSDSPDSSSNVGTTSQWENSSERFTDPNRGSEMNFQKYPISNNKA